MSKGTWRNCIICGDGFLAPRSRLTCSNSCNVLRIYYAKKDEGDSDERDCCPICEHVAANTNELAVHMLKQHDRLILEQDMNAAVARRHAVARRYDEIEEALLA